VSSNPSYCEYTCSPGFAGTNCDPIVNAMCGSAHGKSNIKNEPTGTPAACNPGTKVNRKTPTEAG
jgi:hypothetical protein